jgi:hypothetical protein
MRESRSATSRRGEQSEDAGVDATVDDPPHASERFTKNGVIPATMPQGESRAPTASELAYSPAANERGVTVRYVSSERDPLMFNYRWFFSFGEAKPAADVDGMVRSILAKAGGKKLKRLIIVGHGSPGNQKVSDSDSINVDEIQRLAPLREHFTRDAEVVLQGCSVGGGPQGEQLLASLSQTLGVRVTASTGFERLIPGREGHSTTASPDGTIEMKRSARAGISRLGGFGSHKEDDYVRADLASYAKNDLMGSMPLKLRYQKLVVLVGGYASKDDRKWILSLFEAASPADRRELYRMIEARPWAGDFRRGLLVADDRLWNALSSDEADRLRDLLNEA